MEPSKDTTAWKERERKRRKERKERKKKQIQRKKRRRNGKKKQKERHFITYFPGLVMLTFFLLNFYFGLLFKNIFQHIVGLFSIFYIYIYIYIYIKIINEYILEIYISLMEFRLPPLGFMEFFAKQQSSGS